MHKNAQKGKRSSAKKDSPKKPGGGGGNRMVANNERSTGTFSGGVKDALSTVVPCKQVPAAQGVEKIPRGSKELLILV